MKLRNIFIILIALVFCFSTPAIADVTTDIDETVNGRIVTEYYSDDIFEDVVEYVATIPMTNPPNVDAKSVVLMEASTGKVLYEKNSKEKLSPASITKIMTLLLIVEALDSNKMSLNDTVTTSDHAASMGGSQIWLEPGETMTVDNLLKAVAVGSANDASVALAEYVAGSEEGFVSLMNQRAEELGMKNSHFVNACGLDAENHYTSANDVAIVSRELINHPSIKAYTTIWMDSLRGGDTELVNTNKLVRYYLGATGLKTGTTSKAGFCVSATAKRDNMEIISVVMSGVSSDARFVGAKKLLDYGFANWSIKIPEFDDSVIKDIAVKKGEQQSVEIELEPISSQLIKKGDENKITTELTINESIEAPVAKGQQIGTLKILLDGNEIDQCKVYTVNDVKRISWGFTFVKLLKEIFKL